MVDKSNLVYFVAFGDDCIDQFQLCLASLRQWSDIDVVLVTDTNYKYEGVKSYKVKTPEPPENGDENKQKAQYHAYFLYRTNIFKLVDLYKWDRVWYMDTDFILTGDLFSKYQDPEFIYLCKEPGTHINDIHFCGALTAKEILEDPLKRGINAGLYSVPKKHFGFFEFYHSEVVKMLSSVERAWLCEQHIINMLYVRYSDKFNIKTFDSNDVGFPAKRGHGLLAQHFACYPFDKKLNEMKNEAIRSAIKN